MEDLEDLEDLDYSSIILIRKEEGTSVGGNIKSNECIIP